MNANILCTLLTQRIPPEQFQTRGEEVYFIDPDANNKPVTDPHTSPYDTPENRAIVDDVIANYETLAAECEAAAKEEIEKETLIQNKIRGLAITALQAEDKLTLDCRVVNLAAIKE